MVQWWECKEQDWEYSMAYYNPSEQPSCVLRTLAVLLFYVGLALSHKDTKQGRNWGPKAMLKPATGYTVCTSWIEPAQKKPLSQPASVWSMTDLLETFLFFLNTTLFSNSFGHSEKREHRCVYEIRNTETTCLYLSRTKGCQLSQSFQTTVI